MLLNSSISSASYWNDTVAVKYLPRSITPRRHARADVLALPDRKEADAEKEISRISSLSLVNLVRNVYQIGCARAGVGHPHIGIIGLGEERRGVFEHRKLCASL